MFGRRGLKVEVRDLVKIYKYRGGEVQALRGVTAKFMPGQITCIMGPSGSGKTTLLNLIGGIDKPTGGSIVVSGEGVEVRVHDLSFKALDKYRLQYVGFVFQALNLIPTLTAEENVELPMMLAGMKKKERKERALKLLELVGLADKAGRYPEELSGGEQQRVAIAVALANDPPIILADEPTAELDSDNARAVTNVLRRLVEEFGKTIILSTHDPRVAIKTDRILRLEDGRLVGEYRPIDLERGAGAEAAKEGVAQVTLAELIKMRLASIDDDIARLEEEFKRGLISREEFYSKISRLERLREALRELLTSIGSA